MITTTHRYARIRAEQSFNQKNLNNGGLISNCWDYLTPNMQKIFIDIELEKIIEEEDEQERIAENGQFGVGA